MHRIDADAHVSNHFSDGDAGIGQPGTKVDAAWLNAVQEELCAFLEGIGVTLNKANTGQLLAAFRSHAWQVFTLATGWSAGTGFEARGFIDPTGVVHLRGWLGVGPGATTLVVSPGGIPVALRPNQSTWVTGHYYAGGAATPISILIQSDGRMTLGSVPALGASDELYVDGITYPID